MLAQRLQGEFIGRLRQLRMEAGNLTLQALSKKLHRSDTQLGDMLNGKTQLPSLDLVLAFVDVCANNAAARGRLPGVSTETDYWKYEHGLVERAREYARVDGGRAADKPAIRHRQFAREIFGVEGPLVAVPPPPVPPPSWWLNPRNHVVTFSPPREYETLLRWARGTDGPCVCLVHAPGGVGKTRLAMQLAAVLDQEGQISGLFPPEHLAERIAPAIPRIVGAGHRAFIAVDYAEAQLHHVRLLLDALAHTRPDQVRILLLARTPGRWWENLERNTNAVDLVHREPIELTSIGQDDPVGAMGIAYRDYRRRILGDAGADSQALPEQLSSVANRHSRTLDLHAAALVHVLDGDRSDGVPDTDPLEAALHHERFYWARAAATVARATFADGSRLRDRLLALPTLYPSADAHTAERAVSCLPDPGEDLPCAAEYLAGTLADLYPGTEGHYWSALVPDRLGERLVADVVRAAPSAERMADELVRIHGDIDVASATHAMTVLCRIAGYAADPLSAPHDVADKAQAVIQRLQRLNPRLYRSAWIDAISMINDGKTQRHASVLGGSLAPEGPESLITNTGEVGATAHAHCFWPNTDHLAAGSDSELLNRRHLAVQGVWAIAIRHLAELGIDPAGSIDVIGIGDLSEDALGPAMQTSRKIRLIAAFDHRHIFVDPDPDPDVSYQERQRFVKLPRSSWHDYSRSAISSGGGIWQRTVPVILVSAEMREVLGIPSEIVTLEPDQLIRAILTAPADAIFVARNGTFIKSSHEHDAEVGDPANRTIRVDGRDLRARTVAEGSVNGITQSGRVEFSLSGGLVNTDFLDQSAWDQALSRQANTQILLDRLGASRDHLFGVKSNEHSARIMEEIGESSLRGGLWQDIAMAAARAQAPSLLPVHRRLIAHLEQYGHLDRALQRLPTDDALVVRSGLTSPELAVLMANVKAQLKAEVLNQSQLPDDDWATEVLRNFFPSSVRSRYSSDLKGHPQRREIIAAVLVDATVNLGGITFVYRVVEETAANLDDVLRAVVIVNKTYGLDKLLHDIEASDHLPVQVRTALHLELRRLLDRAVRWLVTNRRAPLEVASEVRRLEPIRELTLKLDTFRGERERNVLRAKTENLVQLGVPAPLAGALTHTTNGFGLLDVIEIAHATGVDVAETAAVYYIVSDRLDVDEILARIAALPREDRWQTLARMALRFDLYAALAALTIEVLEGTRRSDGADVRVVTWEQNNANAIARVRIAIGELLASKADLAALSILLRQIRTLVRISAS
ncbi:NAD-glutamate dehydrogenase domain-containing protein [Micromonospora sp. NPDC049891]|uniref:NAD-glutamate dehydrogenase domain-containing protein n=1 Tax=Micromonospora sp. NPDC049891 TaxID=3155655 RepID=UPI00340E32F4